MTNLGNPAKPQFGGNGKAEKAGQTEDEKMAAILWVRTPLAGIDLTQIRQPRLPRLPNGRLQPRRQVRSPPRRSSHNIDGLQIPAPRRRQLPWRPYQHGSKRPLLPYWSRICALTVVQYGLIKRAINDADRLATANLPARPLESMDPTTLDGHWRAVMNAETLLRTSWMIFLLDLALAMCNRQPPSITLGEFTALRLPSNESMWTATSAADWALMDAISVVRPPTFGDALRSAFGVLTSPPLVSLGAFAGAVLRRTLAYLHHRLSTAPFPALGEEVDTAVVVLWAELGIANPPASRQAALARMAAAQAIVERSCPVYDAAGNAPGSCSLTCLDEEGL
jgi:hypothetical protein